MEQDFLCQEEADYSPVSIITFWTETTCCYRLFVSTISPNHLPIYLNLFLTIYGMLLGDFIAQPMIKIQGSIKD